jgi:phenylacetate-coenzyme A ligase PaaK-like adenylate-forming protein
VRPTFSVERLRTIRSHSSSIKKFVPFLFTPVAVAKARANSSMERFISFATGLAQTVITATVSAVESSKKESTQTGISNLSVKIKSRFLSTELSTNKTAASL